MHARPQAAIVGLTTILLGGCTTINVNGSIKGVTPGIFGAKIVAGMRPQVIAISERAFGLSIDNSNFTAGFKRSQKVFVYDPSQCHLIVFVDKTTLSEREREILTTFPSVSDKICIEPNGG